MKERILDFLKKENKTSAQFAEEIGVQPSGISHILSGRNKPSLDFVLKMLEKYSFLSTDWLLFGRGSMHKEPKMADLFAGMDLDKAEISGDIKGRRLDTDLPDSSQEFKIDDAYLNEPESEPEPEHSRVIKIVWFFEDKTFKEYCPDKD